MRDAEKDGIGGGGKARRGLRGRMHRRMDWRRGHKRKGGAEGTPPKTSGCTLRWILLGIIILTALPTALACALPLMPSRKPGSGNLKDEVAALSS